MVRKDERWLDQTGLNLIRIVIGSYFLAASLDLVISVDQTALFQAFTTPLMADLIGSTLLFVTSVAFMTGIYLRTSALILALFVLCSSLMQNFLLADLENVSDFWRDVTLACAVMLNYSNLSRLGMRRASVMGRRPLKVRKVPLPGNGVTPRRITPVVPEVAEAAPDTRSTLEIPAFIGPTRMKQKTKIETDDERLFKALG